MMNTLPPQVWAVYLRWSLTTLILIVVGTALLNAFIDPLGVFGSPRLRGVNATKPYLDHYREFSRYQAALRLCPDTGIFGNSRAEIGFDPEAHALSKRGLSAFNHAIPGTGAITAYQQLTWLEDVKCFPKTIILGVDFFDFLGGTPSSPLQVKPAPVLDGRFMAESVLSVTGLRDSITTVSLQQARHPAMITPRGFNPLLNYIEEVEQNGHYALFRQRAEENMRNWLRQAPVIRPQGGGPSEDEEAVEGILTKASQAGSKTYIVIYPYHAEIRLMLERLGMGGLFADWKRLVVAIAERHSGVEVWDFSGVSPETLEAIPAKGDRRTHLAYYWEAGHFKKELGDRVLARLMGSKDEFGMKLDALNLDGWLEQDRKNVQKLLTAPSFLLSEVDDVLTRAP